MQHINLKLILGLIGLFLLLPIKANAQFYDSDTEVTVYQYQYGKTVSTSYILAFNFNGNKGAIIAQCNAWIKKTPSFTLPYLSENPNFLKESVYNPKVTVIEYDPSKSDYQYVVYKLTTTSTGSNPAYASPGNLWGNYTSSHTSYFKFSKDRQQLIITGDNTSNSINNKTFSKTSISSLVSRFTEEQAQKERESRWR